MIKFFRKIRQQLITENKFSKYILYAIGEIVLVVIGILIALQINTSNDNRKKSIIKKSYLERLNNDINTELETIEQRIHYYEVVREAAEVTYKQIELINLDGKINKKSFIIRAYLASNIWTYRKANDTYTELISTGDLTLLSDSNLRKELANYYSQLDGLSSYWLSYTDYRDYIRRLIPVEIQRKIRASCDIWEMNQSSVDCNLHLSQNEINKTFSFVLGDDFSKKEDLLHSVNQHISDLDLKILVFKQRSESAKKLLEFMNTLH